MMDMDLNSYIEVYPSMISADLCRKTINGLQMSNWEQHKFYCPDGQYVALSQDNELDISWDEIFGYEKLKEIIWESYNKYLKKHGSPWFHGWSGFNNIRFNRYKEGKQMSLHCDHISDIFDGERKGVPILTCIGLLNDDFAGGEFIMWDKKIELKAGDMMVFPSNFLYPHKVDPVMNGERYSLVSWAW